MIETFVAISVLLLAIVGPMTIATRGLQSAFFAKDQLTAVYLAQEAMEYVRMVRDTNALQSGTVNYLSGLSNCIDVNSAYGCGIDVRPGSTPRVCNSTGSTCTLNYNGTIGNQPGIYTYGSGSQSLFTRVVRISETVPGTEAMVTVTVSWQSSLFAPVSTRTVTLQFRLFNQYADI